MPVRPAPPEHGRAGRRAEPFAAHDAALHASRPNDPSLSERSGGQPAAAPELGPGPALDDRSVEQGQRPAASVSAGGAGKNGARLRARHPGPLVHPDAGDALGSHRRHQGQRRSPGDSLGQLLRRQQPGRGRWVTVSGKPCQEQPTSASRRRQGRHPAVHNQ